MASHNDSVIKHIPFVRFHVSIIWILLLNVKAITNTCFTNYKINIAYNAKYLALNLQCRAVSTIFHVCVMICMGTCIQYTHSSLTLFIWKSIEFICWYFEILNSYIIRSMLSILHHICVFSFNRHILSIIWLNLHTCTHMYVPIRQILIKIQHNVCI